MRSYHTAKFTKIWISLLKFKFLQILLGDKNATYLCSKINSTLFLISFGSDLSKIVTPGLGGFWDQSQVNSALYIEFWSVDPSDLKNVIVGNILLGSFSIVTIMPFEILSKTKITKILLWKVIKIRWFSNFGLGDVKNYI